MTRWFTTSFRRNLVDMHIEDWDERFLSRYDPEKHVEMLALARVTTAMVYAQSHVGLCYWPTRIGHMHKNLAGRDVLGELISRCHDQGMSVVVYYTLTFVNRAYDEHPDWRIVTPQGRDGRGFGLPRYGICCPNTPYRDFALAQTEEIVSGYRFEGLWLDMTFWPDVCYCPSCQARYRAETGRDIPRVVNWEDPEWVRFQRKREAWLAEFAQLCTSTAKRLSLNPDLTVTHQANGLVWDWNMGPSLELARAMDYLSADLYGDSLAQSFTSKFFYNLSQDLPFEYMTSRCPHLFYHTGMKPTELLEAQAFSALAHGAGFLFIDAIDPVGTLDRRVYETMGGVYEKIERYEKYLGGDLCQDVGLYVSLESRILPEDNGKKVEEVSTDAGFFRDRRVPVHSKTARDMAGALLANHVPFGVITKKNIEELTRFKIVILPDVLVMDDEEVKAFEGFVREGGGLLVTRVAARLRKDGTKSDDFLLSELLGVSFRGMRTEFISYVSPTGEGRDLLKPYTAEYPLGTLGPQATVAAHSGARVLATLTLPFTHPGDPKRFASIHSNPPGLPTEHPSLVLHEYGKGKALYVAANLDLKAMEDVFLKLLALIRPEPFAFSSNAPRPVEITLFHQKDRRRFLVNLLNFQAELPNIPVLDIEVKIRLDGKKARGVMELPEENALPFKQADGYVIFIVPRLETFVMAAVDYE